MTPEEEILYKRADELEALGFVMKVSKNSVWYEKGKVKIIATLIMCASQKEWMKFIEDQKK